MFWALQIAVSRDDQQWTYFLGGTLFIHIELMTDVCSGSFAQLIELPQVDIIPFKRNVIRADKLRQKENSLVTHLFLRRHKLLTADQKSPKTWGEI
jgi:hypothetical protein